MADQQTMQDHIDDLMLENAQLHQRVRDWQAIAKQLVDAIEVQVQLARLPRHYTEPHYTQHVKNALAVYEQASQQ